MKTAVFAIAVLLGAPASALEAPSVDMRALCADRRATPFYPPDALALHVEGSVLLDCEVGDDGQFNACSIVSETPPGKDFGAAALVLACRAHFSPDADAQVPATPPETAAPTDQSKAVRCAGA